MLKFNGKNESGRSMVEMLGVLAIVGVLSVSGIAGYTTAMNAHRANEAINRVMRLAVVVSGQKLSGQTASLVGVDAGNVTLTEDTTNGKFTLTISGLSEPVRTKISNMDVATAELSTDAQGNLAFVFNNDLSAGGGKTDSIDVGTCEAGQIYLSYEETHCQAAPANMGCTKNSDCDSGEYCHVTGSWENGGIITGSTCETLNEGTPTTYTYGGEDKELLMVSDGMNWWTAENWCKAHHMNLVNASTLGCTSLGSCGWDAYGALQNAGIDATWVQSSSGNRIWFSAAVYDYELDEISRGTNHSFVCE